MRLGISALDLREDAPASSLPDLSAEAEDCVRSVSNPYNLWGMWEILHTQDDRLLMTCQSGSRGVSLKDVVQLMQQIDQIARSCGFRVVKE